MSASGSPCNCGLRTCRWSTKAGAARFRPSKTARRVANKLGIPYYVLNFAHSFAEDVIERFAEEYLRGRTPNPCIVCNEKVKFGTFLQKALELDCDYVATGHYAIVEYDEDRGRYFLRGAKIRPRIKATPSTG